MRYKRVVSVLLVLLLLLLGGGFFYYNLWQAADVRYVMLDTYVVPPTATTALIVENRGRKTAEEVHIKVTLLEGEVEKLYFRSGEQSEPELVNGGPGNGYFALKVPRMERGSSTVVYVQTGLPVTFAEQPEVTWKEGVAKPWSARSPTGTVILIVEIFAVLLLMVLATSGAATITYRLLRW